MSRITLITASVAITLGLAALVNVARAADQSPQPANFGRMSLMCGDMAARMAARMAYNEVKLNLTESQKAEYKRLAGIMTEASAPIAKMCEDRADPSKLSTLPERMGRMQQMTEARAESMRKLVPAMNAFYSTLSLEQQKIADGLMGGMGGRSGFGSPGGHGPMMMHHWGKQPS